MLYLNEIYTNSIKFPFDSDSYDLFTCSIYLIHIFACAFCIEKKNDGCNETLFTQRRMVCFHPYIIIYLYWRRAHKQQTEK
jgi:hypothetical protein